jgi:YjbE family integral membrane protein
LEFLSVEWFTRLLGVLGVDLILAGDNAVVIALAVRNLEGKNRRRAILLGALGAVVLRLIFAAIVSYLLLIPFLQVAGGLLLLWIAWKLVNEDHGGEEEEVQAGESQWEAIRIIILADVVMSLDNVIALVGVSGGDLLLLSTGIALTIPLVIFGAALLTSLLDRFPVLIYAGAGLLVYIAVEMFFGDVFLHEYLEPYESFEWLVGIAATAVFLAIVWLWTRRRRRAASTEEDAEKP